MTTKSAQRLSLAVREADLAAFTALQNLKDYSPLNPALTLEAINALNETRMAAESREIHARNELAAARDALLTAEYELHTMLLNAKHQVIAQYGPNSDQIQSLGWKKKFKYRRPSNRGNGQKERPTNGVHATDAE